MKTINLELFLVLDTAPIRLCMKAMDLNKNGIVFITNDLKKQKVIGLATDGDIRDALLKGASLEDKIEKYYNKKFTWFDVTTPREEILKNLDSNIKVIPILNKNQTLFDIASRDYLPLLNEKKIYARSKAPARITFGGGGSDLTHFFIKDKGAVINATISIFSHALLKQRNDKRIFIRSHDLETDWSFDDIDEVFSIVDTKFNLFQSLLKAIKPTYGFELLVYSDFPNGSGLGGSSAVSAAVIGCFNEFRIDKWDLHEMAELAFQAERLHMDISGGWQDQYATVFGGVNFIEFQKDKNHVHSLKISKNIMLEIEENLLLFKLPKGRSIDGDSIHEDQKESMKNKEINTRVRKAVNLCYSMKEQLIRGDLKDFGSSLDTAWSLKSKFSTKISNSEIDSLYEYAIQNGALGGKLLGAGGGGYFLFYVNPMDKHVFKKAMQERDLEATDFLFVENGMQSWTIRDKD